jgi:acyl-CoA reductase-like NAD-dependent aldehyde dehydrogenase
MTLSYLGKLSNDHLYYIYQFAELTVKQPGIMTEQLVTISPSTNKAVVHRDATSPVDIAALPRKAEQSFEAYRSTLLSHRQDIVRRALDLLQNKKDELARELTEQMGRPIAYTGKEIATAVARGKYLLEISEDALKDTEGEAEQGFKRYIKKVPVGPVLIIFAWNVS